MDNKLKEVIFEYLSDETKTLIFTSEVVARSWLRRYTIESSNKTVFLEHAISWDTFKASFVKPEKLKQVSKIERQIFANRFLKDNFDQLTFFSSKYRESFVPFASAIASYLPFFAYADAKSSDALHDISLITNAYKQFLEQNNLFEYNFLKKDYSFLNKDYVLVYPETFNDPIVDEIKDLCTVIGTGTISNKKNEIFSYKNSLNEIKNTMRQIALCLDNGMDANDIALTCAGIDLYRPYLEEEASKLDIDLCFTTSRKISSSPQGRFFASLYRLVNEDFNFRAVKSFLLDPAYPFKETKKNLMLINSAIRLRLKNEGHEEWLATLDNQDDRIFFDELSNSAISVVNASSVEEMKVALDSFVTEFFACDAFFFSQNGVYEKCLKLLGELGSIVNSSEEIYPLFLQILEGENYIDSARNGVRVYKYPVSSALAVEKHFVIGLDDKNTVVSFDKYPYLPAYKKDKNDLEKTVKTEDVLSVYSTCILSGTKSGFDGSRLLPVTLKTIEPEILEDIYSNEEKLWAGESKPGKVSKSQKAGFDIAKICSLQYQGPVEIANSNELQNRDISASQFKNFAKCPFMGYVDIYLKPKQIDYEPDYLDPRVIGNILHETIQNSLKDVIDYSKLTKDILVKNLQLAIENAGLKRELGPKVYQSFVEKRYAKLLPAFVNSNDILSGSSLYNNELTFKKKYEIKGLNNVNLKGRPDTVLTKDDSFIIIDYKTSKGDYSTDIDNTNPQVMLYARILMDNVQGAKVLAGAYYVINEGSMKFVWPQKNIPDFEAAEIALQKKEDQLRTSILNANFEALGDEDSCKNCRYRGICRRRFAVK